MLTELEQRILWFRAHGVRYPAIARNTGRSYRAVKAAAASAQRKIEAAQVQSARQVLATFGKAPGAARPATEHAPRPRLVSIEDLVGAERRVLSDLIEVG